MSEPLDSFQVTQATLIAERNSKATTLRNTLQSLKKKGDELLAAQRSGSESVATLQTDYDDLLILADTQRGELNASEVAIDSAAKSFYEGSEGAFPDVIGNLNSENPVLFFPVRLETKYRTSDGETTTLDIRIYPDDLMVQTHEHLLTDLEFDSGKDYWNAVWIQDTIIPTNQEKIDAWDILVKTYGKERAAWIRTQSTPTNISYIEVSGTTAAFPTLTTNSDSWTEQPFTRILPDRFVVVAYPKDVGGVQLDPIVTVGNPIPEKVKIGVSPNFDDEGIYYNPDNTIAADDATRWMIDFDIDVDYSAVAVGLGVKMGLMADVTGESGQLLASEGFSKIIAWGINTSLNEADSKTLLEDLINNHHYTNGFSLLKQGTSTKNLANERAGYSSFEFDPENSHARECEGDLFSPVDSDKSKTDGQRLAEALGISYDTLSHIENSDGYDIRNALLSNNVLWAGGTGFYMSEMMHPVFSADDVEKARDFYTNFISGRGAIPSIRVGTQPYGILPIASNKDITWDETEPNADFYDRYNTFFNKVNDYWKANAVAPASSENISETPIDDITKTLGRNALTTERYFRSGAGPELVWNSLMFDNRHTDAASWHEGKLSAAADTLTELGFSSEVIPKILMTSFSGEEVESDVSLVADRVSSNELEEIEGSEVNFINLLLNSTLDEIIDEDYASFGIGQAPTSLMYKSLRLSLLTEYWNFAADLLQLSDEDRQLSEFFNDGTEISGGDPPEGGELTVGRNRITYFDEEYPEGSGETIASIINSGAYTEMDEGNKIVSVRDDLAILAGISSKELDILFNEHLDVNTHRIHSWTYGPIHQRLKYLRNTLPGTSYSERNTATYLGAYGWLMNVKNESVSSTPQANKFMLAPSINQAITAALLRNGYDMSNNFVSSELSAVNLTSERVREALFIIDGIMKGNPLGELLGYQFEKELLNSYALAGYIDDIRHLFPFTVVTAYDSADESKRIKARGVVNGLKLIQKYQEDTSASFGVIFSSALESALDSIQQGQILNSIKRICAIMDAVGDLAVAEGVFQIVQGNYDRAGALGDSLSNGRTPVKPDVIDTQRKGYGITNKITINMELKTAEDLITADVYNLDTVEKLSARQMADPTLDFWIRKIIGNDTISNTICHVDYKVDGIDDNCQISLSDLNLWPIDCLFIIGGQDLDAELRERICRHIMTVTVSPDITDVIIDFKFKDVGKFSIYEFQGLMKHLLKVVTNSPYLKTSDYSWGLDTPDELFDVDEIRNRIELQYQSYLAKKNTLVDEYTNQDDYEEWAKALFALAQFGLPHTLGHADNLTIISTDATKLNQDTEAVLEIIESKEHKIDDFRTQMFDANLSANKQVEAAIEVAKLVFGSSFRVLPQYNLGNASYSIMKSIETGNPLMDDAVNNDSVMAMEEWLHDAGKVRERITDMEVLSLLKECFDTTYDLDVIPAQLPYEPIDSNGYDNNRWMGLEVDKSRMKDGRLCLAINSYDTFYDEVSGGNNLCGILIDEWIELIPLENHSAAVALNYNQPNSQAPQCLLLAVPSILPNESIPATMNWKQDDIQAMLEQTLDDAIVRSADYDAIKGTPLGEFLPLTLYPVTRFGSRAISAKAGDFRKQQ